MPTENDTQTLKKNLQLISNSINVKLKTIYQKLEKDNSSFLQKELAENQKIYDAVHTIKKILFLFPRGAVNFPRKEWGINMEEDYRQQINHHYEFDENLKKNLPKFTSPSMSKEQIALAATATHIHLHATLLEDTAKFYKNKVESLRELIEKERQNNA